MPSGVLLVDNSAYNHTNLSKRDDSSGDHAPELYYSPGILAVGAFLRDRGVDVEYLSLADIDGGRTPETSLREAISRSAMIGVNAYTPNVARAAETCALAKRINPAIVTVLGGNHVSALDEQSLATLPSVDVIVRDEGEETLHELVLRHGDPVGVLGVTYRTPTGTVRNPSRPLLAPERIPTPAYELLPFPLSRYLICLTTQRGCMNRCAFCAEGRPLGRQRFRDTAAVEQELLWLAGRLGPGARLYVADSIFVSREARTLDLCAAIRRHNQGWALGCNLYCTLVSPAIVQGLTNAGFNLFFVGFESATAEVLDATGRTRAGATLGANVEMCNRIHGASDAMVRSNWIVGLPGSTDETIERDVCTMEALLDQGVIDYAVVKNLIPYPGTDVFAAPGNFGIDIQSYEWSDYSRDRPPVYCLPNMPRERILEHRVRAQERVQHAYRTRRAPVGEGLRRSIDLWDLPGMRQ